MIETERLVLRPHVPADLDPWHALFSDAELFRFIGPPNPSREDAWNRMLRYAGHWSLFGYGLFAVIDRVSGQLIGEVGLADFHRGLGPLFDGFPEAAWIMARSAQGRGLAHEAVRACLGWFEAQRGRGRTVCIIGPENEPSLRLAAKLGYRQFEESTYKQGPVVLLERVSG